MKIATGSSRLFAIGRIHTAFALRKELSTLRDSEHKLRADIARLQAKLAALPAAIAEKERHIQEFESSNDIHWRTQ